MTKERRRKENGTPDTFADYTNHDFKAFYMERGAGASNLDIQFNLKVVRPGEVVVEKQIPEGVDLRFVNQEYKFRALFKDYTHSEVVKPLNEEATYDNDKSVCTGIYYKDRKDDEGNPVKVPVDANGYFTLKAGEAAVFQLSDKKIEYTIKEVEIDIEKKTQKVEINGQVAEVEDGTAEAAYAKVGDRSQLKYKNHPYLQNLDITKHILPEGTQSAPGAVFKLYKDGTLFDTKTTDSNGRVTFGYPDKLLTGNYSIRQVSTEEGLETAVDQIFAILENGNPNQTISKTFVNDELNRYYSLTFHSSSDNGIVKTFTAATGDSNEQATVENEPGTALPNAGGPGTRVFTILGSILIFGAVALLWRRRRMI